MPIGQPVTYKSQFSVVAFGPDGRTMLTGSADGAARLCDVATQKPIGAPLRHDAFVRGVAFRHDGKIILTGSDDRTARLWKAPPPPLQGDVARIVLWTQVITSQELAESGGVHSLSAETWRERRQQLQALGGPPILRDEVSQ